MPTPILLPLSIEAKPAKQLKRTYRTIFDGLQRGEILDARRLTPLREQMTEIVAQHEAWQSAVQRAELEQQLLHLTHADTDLLNLPWRLVATHAPLLALTKGLPTSESLPAFLPRNPLPLKILVMVSAPEDLDITGRLSYEEEEDQILKAFEKLYEHGLVQIDFTQDGSLATLEQQLAENHYHILHFSGHGTYQDGVGYLQLEDPVTQNTDLVTDKAFARALNKKPGHRPSLVLLASCDSGQGKVEGELFSGVSNLLLHIGVPAVVAMNWKISDYFATIFAAEFYRRLAEKTALPQAFQEAVRHVQQAEAQAYQQQPGLTPHQWLIPQLFLGQWCEHLVDWAAPQEKLTFTAHKFVTGKDQLLLAQRKNYQFIGRRQERRRALPLLKEKTPVLLVGQGGVGKTALAEHLVRRLIAADPRVQPFVFDETTGSMEKVIESLLFYLQKEHRRFLIRKEIEEVSEQAEEQLLWLLQELDRACRPVFVFDNLESFQEEPGGPFKLEHADLLAVIKLLVDNNWFPLLLTGRYPLADFPDLEKVDLNQVRFADFWKKCHQLALAELREHLRKMAADAAAPTTFREIVELLHRTFGGNYRVLEFFDELYQEKRSEILGTLAQLNEFLQEKTGDLLQRVSKNLVFRELLALLNDAERWALGMLTHFRRPVLPLALEMQDVDRSVEPALHRLQQLTLLEAHRENFDTSQGLIYYYATPIVRQLLAQQENGAITFSHPAAGRYYEYVDQHINHRTYADLEEAFFHYTQAGNLDKVNTIAETLSSFYYGRSLYRTALGYAVAAEELAGHQIAPGLINRIGLILLTFGQIPAALTYFERKLVIDREIGDRSGEGTTLNNISQIYDAKGDYDTALRYLQQSLNIQQEIGDRSGMIPTLHNMAQIAWEKQDFQAYYKYEMEAYQMAVATGDAMGLYQVGKNLGPVLCQAGQHEQGLAMLQQSYTIARQAGFPDAAHIAALIEQYAKTD